MENRRNCPEFTEWISWGPSAICEWAVDTVERPWTEYCDGKITQVDDGIPPLW